MNSADKKNNLLSNKFKWSKFFLIDYLISIAFLCYIFVVWKNYPFSIGGSLVFVNLIALASYFSFVYKEFSKDISLFLLILFLLIVFDFIAYIEQLNGFSIGVMVSYFIVLLIFFISFICLLLKPIVQLKVESPTKIELIRRIAGFIGLKLAFYWVGFTLITAGIFLAHRESGIVRSNILNFSNLSTGWLVIGLLVLLIGKRRVLDKNLPYLIVKKSNRNMDPFKKWFLPILMVIFLFGSGLELMRGLWVSWFCSWLVFVLVILNMWKIWKQVFNKDSTANIDEDEYMLLPSIYDHKDFLKQLIFGGIFGFVYILLLSIILIISRLD